PHSNFNIRSVRNQSLANAVFLASKSAGLTNRLNNQVGTAQRRRPGRIAHPEVRIVIAGCLMLLVAVGLALRRRGSALDQATAYSLAICATLVVSPLAWGHYYMALAPAVLLVPLWLFDHGLPRLAQVASVVPPILCWSYYVAMDYTGALGILGLG